jgi:hypothetical protein
MPFEAAGQVLRGIGSVSHMRLTAWGGDGDPIEEEGVDFPEHTTIFNPVPSTKEY